MTFYITTPIYYVNDTPHIGHAYTTVIADILARIHRLRGETTFFLTGTDEHGQKVQQAARARDVTPEVHVDEMVKRFSAIWEELSISNDAFIRTTDGYHKKVVQNALDLLYRRGEIYSADYEGWYSVSEEIFYTEDELVDGKSPQGKEVVKVREKNYFFRMSRYQDQLLSHIETHREFIQPEGKRSEVLGFLRKPLGDLCISRPKTRLSWGVTIPFDEDYVTYVWFDALLNYVAALGYGEEDSTRFATFWPEALHLIGKDILITHAVYWPTMLLALGIPLPKTIFAHGWWLTEDNKKMSKSEGPVVKPLDVKNLVGVDAFRYFLARERHPASDGQFSLDLVVSRVNADLANNLGNLVSRVTALVAKYFDGKVPAYGRDRTAEGPLAAELGSAAAQTVHDYNSAIETLSLSSALEGVAHLLSLANRTLDARAPWKTAKSDLSHAGETLGSILELIRITSVLLYPVMPTKMTELRNRLNLPPLESGSFSKEVTWGSLLPGAPVTGGEALFPRCEVEK